MIGNDVTENLRLLSEGTLEIHGLVNWGSNYTFLIDVSLGDVSTLAVYKPAQGEQPLWDFESGTLFRREVAAFLVSEMLGWHLVPATVVIDGPHGPGSLQQFINHDPELHYFTLAESHRDQLQRIALFDFIINNADRKGGHVLVAEDGKLWAIDHGVAFHATNKLRTVIWNFSGEPIPPRFRSELASFESRLSSDSSDQHGQLERLLSSDEWQALLARTSEIVESGQFPEPGEGRHFPWPPV